MTELWKFTRIPAIIVLGSVAAVIVVPVYATLAFRRVYGGPSAKTIAKELGIGAIYAIISGVAFVVMIYWVSVAT